MDMAYNNQANVFDTHLCVNSSRIAPVVVEKLTPTKAPTSSVLQDTPEKTCNASFDLAAHVSAPSFPCAASDIVAQVGGPTQIMYDSSVADAVEKMLQEGNRKDSETLIAWIQ